MRLLTADWVNRRRTAASLTVPKRSSAISASMPDNIFQILLHFNPIIPFICRSGRPILGRMTEVRPGERHWPSAPTTTTVAAATDSVGEAWDALLGHLETRFRQCCDELRHYPTPIARCDDQLPKLIEQRDHARAELERMTATARTATSV